MTWKILNTMNERMRFVLTAKEETGSFAELCREFGISRACGYKWLRRYEERGINGLVDLSRRPKHIPHEVSGDVICQIIKIRTLHPTWGGRKIGGHLKLKGIKPPAPRTIDRVLERSGLVIKRRRRRKKFFSNAEVVEARYPNHVWTVDFKGQWPTKDGSVVYPLTVRDECSKFILGCVALTKHGFEEVRAAFIKLFELYGLPEIIRSDNGSPFACSKALCGLSRLSVWWMELGILPNRMPPAAPQYNPGHERMHRDMKAELQINPAQNPQFEQARFDDWRKDYNYFRPHQALNNQPPASAYKHSSRLFQDIPVQYDYPNHFHRRKVLAHGKVNWQNAEHFISKALMNKNIGFEIVSRKRMNIWFCEFLLASSDPALASALTEYSLFKDPFRYANAA